LENVVAVTAVDIERHLYNQATRGNFIDVAAPGVEIVSIGPGARLPISSGTSFSAAFVSGVIALLLEQRTNAVPQQLQTILEKTSRDLGAPSRRAVTGLLRLLFFLLRNDRRHGGPAGAPPRQVQQIGHCGKKL
jgi:subtilisin family serine protease